ncbi:MAG: class I adenylate-forming enzyme family protein [Acidimicrobiia bacterium]
MSEVVSYGRRLSQMAAMRPDQADLTIVDREGHETRVAWRVLESRANQIARALEGHGASTGSIIALALPTCLDHILVTMATWKIGATLLPLRHDLPQWEMDRLVGAAEPLVLISDNHSATFTVLRRSDLDATTSLPDDAVEDRIPQTLYLGASSGSTGLPKLIAAPFPGVVAIDPDAVSYAQTSAILVVSPLYHVNGFLFCAPQLMEGTKVAVMEKFEAKLAVELIERLQISMTIMVPTMLQRIVQLPDLDKASFRSLERVVIGGAKTPDWVIDRWLELVPGRALNFIYGSTERIGSVNMNGDQWREHRGAAGRGSDCEVSIRDAEGNVVPNGEIGEVFVRPLDPNRPLFRYLGAPMPPMTTDGFLSIGDLGWLDDDGYLYIADRRTDMIITGGANVFPAEVEAALSEHPAVADQVVVPVADPEWGHRVHAIIAPVDPGSPPSAEELREFCKSRLASYKVPKSFDFVAAVPRTEAGKLNRTALGKSVDGNA